jgi:SagB-type dehydrogenase family enzyme
MQKYVVTGLIGIWVLGCAAAGHAQEQEPIVLTEPDLQSGTLLMDALKQRRSRRAFSDKALPMEDISNLLWAAFGVNRPASGKRTAPSAKNMQEIDIYVAMPQGLYRYDAAQHALQPVHDQDIRAFTGKQNFTQVAPVNLIYVADYQRMGGNQAVNQFYAAADTGFISQNVYLYCASKGWATVVLGWIDKATLADKMGLGGQQHVILTQPVGYPAE